MSLRHIFRNFIPATLKKGGSWLLYEEVCFVHRTRSISTVVSALKLKRPVSVLPGVPSVLFCRFYNRQQNEIPAAQVWRKRLWRIVRGIFLATGGLVWTVAFLAYLSLEKVNVDIQGNGSDSGLGGLERKLVNHFYNEKDEVGILRKDEAPDRVWRKLNKEERIQEVFGMPVYMCGYNYSSKIEEVIDQADLNEKNTQPTDKEFMETELKQETTRNENRKNELSGNKLLWEAGCYIEGPKNVGLMKVIFEEHNKEWVPIALHVETLQKSGFIVTDVSASLPNGLKNFTRLTN